MTDIVLNQLYPGGVMKQLGDAAGGVAYNQYAAGGCVGQLYTAAGADVPLDQYAPGGPLHQIEEEIESGGDLPDWVPADAVIHIDLVRAFNALDAAWVQGTGVVAVGTLLGSDAVIDGFFGESSYNPANLTEDGYYTILGVLAFVGAAKTKTLSGSTFVSVCKAIDDGTIYGFGAVNPEYTHLLSIDANVNEATPDVVVGGASGPFDTIEDALNLTPGLNKIAHTFTPTRIEVAANGSTATTHALVADDVGDPFDLAAACWNIGSSAVQSFTWRDALPSTAGLSELSETA